MPNHSLYLRLPRLILQSWHNTYMRSATLKKYLKIIKTIFPGKRTGWVALLVAALVVAIAVVEPYEPQPLPQHSSLPVTNPNHLYPVEEVVDGDTIKILVDNSIIPIRMIGVDTPESVDPRRTVQCFGREAALYTRSLLQGQKVFVIADATQDNADKYQRLLRYIKRADGLEINETLLMQGYAYEYTFIVPYQRQQRFRQLEDQARQLKRGLWDPNTCDGQR